MNVVYKNEMLEKIDDLFCSN